MATPKIKYGLNLFRLLRNLKEMNFPKIMVKAINGKVPIPKANIRIPLLRMSPVAKAAAIARYTNPHGKNPFAIPIEK
jgi:hypothetical protein